jgi:hypothetical protein
MVLHIKSAGIPVVAIIAGPSKRATAGTIFKKCDRANHMLKTNSRC